MDYDTASPATEAPPPPQHPRMDCAPDYIKTIPAILKLVQMVASILTFGLSVSGSWGGGGGWVAFVSISAFIHAVIWFVLHLISLVPDVLINFFVEVIGYCIWTLFFFISGIVAAVAAGSSGVAGAAAFFAFVCMGVYGADAVMQLLEIRRIWKERNDRRQVPSRAAEEDDIFIQPTR